MNKECPRVYLNGLRCARCSAPVFHPGAEAMPREATPGFGPMSAQLVHNIVLSSNGHLHKQDTTLLIT